MSQEIPKVSFKDKTTELVGKTKEWINNIDVDKQKFIDFLKKYYLHIIITLFVSFVVIFFFTSIYRRIPRYLSRMDIYEVDILPLQYNPKVLKGNYRLCDFYVASSYKSYLPCTNYYDYASVDSIKKVLQCGARYIDLDVFNRNFNPCTEPVVCAGRETGNWHYTTRVSFEDCIRTIAICGFGPDVKNPTDPLFININFKTWGNSLTIDKCARIIKEYLGHKLLGPEYSYQGRYAGDNGQLSNICTAPILELLDKVIIISTGDISDTEMDEITNLNPNIVGNLRDLTYPQVKDSYDTSEITEYSKKNMTRVLPHFNNRTKENYNFFTPYYLGCQFICLNYTEPDEFMQAYMKRFGKSSFILKPYKLRYHPITIKQPLKQLKEVSFAPKQYTTPFFSITY
jgi:hypothetical protein